MRLCNLVLADIDTVGVIDSPVGVDRSIHARVCTEDFLQCSGPCTQHIVERNSRVAVAECIVIRHLADHSICRHKVSYLSVLHLDQQVSVCRREEIARIEIMLDLYAKAVTEGHLGCRRRDAVALERVG